MEIRLLGPIEVWVDHRCLPLGSPQQSLVLAALAVDAGRLVSTDALIDRVWDAPPASARQTMYVYLSRVRRVIASTPLADVVGLIRRPRGYVLEIQREHVDVLRFRRLVAQAREDVLADTERINLWRRAIAEWRGEPLSGMSSRWAVQTRETWQQEYLDAVVGWSGAELRAGNAAGVLGPLVDLADRYPLAESVAGTLMRALLAVGRPADALRRYGILRQRLAEELGIDPSGEVREVYQAILNADPAARTSAAPRAGVPRLLPRDVAGFAGRVAELDRLDAIATTGEAEPTTAVVSAVSGVAGAGKTALAVHWAWLAADRFPDGQLYVDLAGFSPSASPLSPSQVIRTFLHALGVSAPRVPADEAVQIGLYRSILADRRMLILLDNARDAEQVRPLLPGSPASMVVVTSRNQLSGLVAAEGAHPVMLGLLSGTEAWQLLARRLGPHRLAAEPNAVDEIIIRCAGLPLALAIVAARAATHPEFPLAVIAAELADAAGRLDAMAGEDQVTDIRAVFSWSYRGLSPEAARQFRLFGSAPGPDIGVAAAANLAGSTMWQVQPWLTELALGHLVIERTPHRYAMHDLLRVYATELARHPDLDDDVAAAQRRLLDYYLHTALAADRLLDPKRTTFALAATAPGTTPGTFADRAEATAWYMAEHHTLMAAVRDAAERGFDAHAWQLVWAMGQYFDGQGHWKDWIAVGHLAQTAAGRLNDLRAQAEAHRALGRASARLGDLDTARGHLDSAVALFATAGEHTAEAFVHATLSALLARDGRLRAALEHAERGLAIHRAASSPAAQGRTLNNVAMCHAMLGEHDQAMAACREAIELQREAADQIGEAASVDTLGYIYQRTGDFHHAVAHHERALSLLVRCGGDRRYQAETLVNLGDARCGAGQVVAAGEAWRQALAILDDLDHPEAEGVRVRLARMSP